MTIGIEKVSAPGACIHSWTVGPPAEPLLVRSGRGRSRRVCRCAYAVERAGLKPCLHVALGSGLRRNRSWGCRTRERDLRHLHAAEVRRTGGTVWVRAKTRCVTPQTACRGAHHVLGIRIVRQFDCFREHLGFKPRPGRRLGRNASDGRCEPGNRRCGLPRPQAGTRRNTRRFVVEEAVCPKVEGARLLDTMRGDACALAQDEPRPLRRAGSLSAREMITGIARGLGPVEPVTSAALWESADHA